MRFLAELSTDTLVQVPKTPAIGEGIETNGKYVLAVPEGVLLRPDGDSIVLPAADPNSVIGQMFAGLLAQYPMFTNIVFNPLIEDTDMDELDLTATVDFGGNTYTTRAQVGRDTAGAPSGQAANSTAVLAVNDTLGLGLDRPGVLVTETIDLAPFLPAPPPGECEIPAVEEVMLWWQLHDFAVSEDIHGNFGQFNGVDSPSIKQWIEVEQEPADLQVLVSLDDGSTWDPVGRLEPVCVCPGTLLRVAFLNFGSAKLFLTSFAILF